MRNDRTALNSTPIDLRESARLLLQRMKRTSNAEQKRMLATRAFRLAQQVELVAVASPNCPSQ
jgi:hypothetical protein